MNKRPLSLLITLVIIIIGMFSMIFYQNGNAPPPPIGADKEGGIIFGGVAPVKSKTMTDASFTPADESTADAASCE